MRRITKTEAEDIRDRIEDKRYIMRGVWNSHGYGYKINWQYVDGQGAGWLIEAGCRMWLSVAEMLKHYRDPTWRVGLYTPKQRTRYRAEMKDIAADMRKVCRKFGIRLLEEKRRKRKR